MKNLCGVDFETRAIQRRPEYPPEPVGVALWAGPRDKKYLAWGHPEGNNCTKREAERELRRVMSTMVPVFHNAEFDSAILRKFFNIKLPPLWHDTMFLAFLHDPRDDLALKPLADKYLGMPPRERDMLEEWIIKHVFKGKKPTKSDPWGAHICDAPGNIVAPYAIGDTERTVKLAKYLYPIVRDRGMLDAYERERMNMPVFSDMSERGLKIDMRRLERDFERWQKEQAARAEWIRKRLKQPKSFNEFDSKGRLISTGINSNTQLADAMEEAGKVTHWIYTAPSDKHPDGQRSVKRENLLEVCLDKKLMEELTRFGVLETYMGTFAIPWLESNDGRVYPSFSQVRNMSEDGKFSGTRTGRPSSSQPNFLNIPRNQEDALLPNMRDYIVPDDGCVLLIRDYNQQELRIAAHFEKGELYTAYINDPLTDAHELVRQLIHEIVGVLYPRSPVKVVNFGKIYGMGVAGVAKKIKGTHQEAQSLVNAHRRALPGLDRLMRDVSKRAKKGEPIITWGGRWYYAEEPKIIKGVKRDFSYKMLNYLVQGSAADCTKEAMLRFEQLRHSSSRICLQVYDEIIAQAEISRLKQEMAALKEAMESVEFSVPMLSDGKLGRKSWGEAKKYKD